VDTIKTNPSNKNYYILERAQEEMRLESDLVIMALISLVLAIFGIVLDNQYITIGAMLISPFVEPIIAFTAFLLLGKLKPAFLSLLSLIILILIAVFFAVVVFEIWSYFSPELNALIYTPHVGWAYLWVSIIFGILGCLMWVWPNTPNILAGLSVGIALESPLSGFAISLVHWDMTHLVISLAAIINSIVGIVLGAILVFGFYIKFPNKHNQV
jgi:uncharacterized membrane protein